jgi:hypothetical protein
LRLNGFSVSASLSLVRPSSMESFECSIPMCA